MICRDGKMCGAPLAIHTLAKGCPVRQQEGKHPQDERTSDFSQGINNSTKTTNSVMTGKLMVIFNKY